MAVILALDTSTEACSCALSLHGEIHEHFRLAPRQHAQLLLPMIDALLTGHGLSFSRLDALAFGRGPGSFTGLRIAAGVAQGIAFAASLPVVAVSSLAALAGDTLATTGADSVLACLDARIDEVYWGLYTRDGELPALCGEEGLCHPELLTLPDDRLPHALAVGGDGLVYRSRFPRALTDRFTHECPDLLPKAGWIARIATHDFARGHTIDAAAVSPVYLRDQVTRPPRES